MSTSVKMADETHSFERLMLSKVTFSLEILMQMRPVREFTEVNETKDNEKEKKFRRVQFLSGDEALEKPGRNRLTH